MKCVSNPGSSLLVIKFFLVIFLVQNLVDAEPDKIPGIPDKAHDQLINSTKVLRQESVQDFWTDAGKELTKTWTAVKKVATKVVQVVDRIFTQRPQQVSSNGTETREWRPWNMTVWNMTIQARRQEREQRRKKKDKESTMPMNDGLGRKECAGAHSYEGVRSYEGVHSYEGAHSYEGLNEDKTGKGCFCDSGYTFDDNDPNAGCVDIDECENRNGSSSALCGDNATCINTDGSFICQCPIGTTGDPSKDCFKVDGDNLTTSETTKATIVSTENSIASTKDSVVSTKDSIVSTENSIVNEVIAPQDKKNFVISDG